jgi:predicted amino acid dehydrogenase
MPPVKLIMSWDIAPDHEQEYFEFVIREFLPGMQKLGFELSDAWATVYGDEPQIMVAALLPSLENAKIMLVSREWTSLYNRLLDYVQNYNQKLISARGGFQF